jgi:hypothetical protein
MYGGDAARRPLSPGADGVDPAHFTGQIVEIEAAAAATKDDPRPGRVKHRGPLYFPLSYSRLAWRARPTRECM